MTQTAKYRFLSGKRFGECCIALFCVWQMFAVAVVSAPFSDHRPVTQWIHDNLKPVVDPYIYATNQWQRWHMFVPENPTYDYRYVIEGTAAGIHHPAYLLNSEQSSVLQGSDRTAQNEVLSAACAFIGESSRTPVWFSERDYVLLPRNTLKHPEDGMNHSFEWFQYYRQRFACP